MKLNGDEIALEKETDLARFLAARGYKDGTVAVQLNDAIVPRDAFDHVILHDGDVLEVLHFVGGGAFPRAAE